MEEIGRYTSVIQDEKKILKSVVNVMRQRLAFDHGVILLVDKSKH